MACFGCRRIVCAAGDIHFDSDRLAISRCIDRIGNLLLNHTAHFQHAGFNIIQLSVELLGDMMRVQIFIFHTVIPATSANVTTQP